MTLEFKVTGQHIVWVNNTEYVVADSRNYLKAVFDLPEGWTYPATVLFKGKCKTVPVLLAQAGEEITVPPEVIKAPMMLVSCYCGDLMTTDSARVTIAASGYTSDTDDTQSSEQSDYYSQMIAYIGQINALIGDGAGAQDALTKLQGVIEKAQAATTLPDATVTGQMDALINQYLSNEDAVANQILDNSLRRLISAVKTVEMNKFYYSDALEEVYLPNAQVIKQGAFVSCKNLRKIYIPVCKDIGQEAFGSWNPMHAEKFYAPKVRTLGKGALRTQADIQRLDFNIIERIEAEALQSTKALKALIIRSLQPCLLLNADAFVKSAIKSGTGYIYVPRALIDDYKTATNWTVYAAQFRAIEDYPDICAPEEWED